MQFFFLETGSEDIAQAGLKWTTYVRMASNSNPSAFSSLVLWVEVYEAGK